MLPVLERADDDSAVWRKEPAAAKRTYGQRTPVRSTMRRSSGFFATRSRRDAPSDAAADPKPPPPPPLSTSNVDVIDMEVGPFAESRRSSSLQVPGWPKPGVAGTWIGNEFWNFWFEKTSLSMEEIVLDCFEKTAVVDWWPNGSEPMKSLVCCSAGEIVTYIVSLKKNRGNHIEMVSPNLISKIEILEGRDVVWLADLQVATNRKTKPNSKRFIGARSIPCRRWRRRRRRWWFQAGGRLSWRRTRRTFWNSAPSCAPATTRRSSSLARRRRFRRPLRRRFRRPRPAAAAGASPSSAAVDCCHWKRRRPLVRPFDFE